MKDIDLEKYYEDQLDMFALPGWKEIISKVEELKVAYSDLSRINTTETLFYSKGQLDILNWLLSWEPLVREAQTQNEIDV